MMLRFAKALVPLALIAVCAAAAPTTVPSTPAGGVDVAAGSGMTNFRGLTEPSKRIKVNLRGGTIKQLLVNRGDKVKKGEVLLTVHEEDEERAKLEMYKIDADSTVAIETGKAKRDKARNDLKRIQKMFDKQVASEYELESAKLDVRVAELEIEKAQQDQAQKKVQVRYQEAVLANLRIVSPVDGIVEDLACREGEVLNPQGQDGAIILVQNDPLDVKVDLPVTVAQRIKVGQHLGVLLPGETQPRDAEVYYRSPMINAGANEQVVRLHLANTDGRDAGMWVQVQVPENLTGGIASNQN